MDNYLLSKKNADNPFEFYGFSICDTDNNIEVYLGDISDLFRSFIDYLYNQFAFFV